MVTFQDFVYIDLKKEIELNFFKCHDVVLHLRDSKYHIVGLNFLKRYFKNKYPGMYVGNWYYRKDDMHYIELPTEVFKKGKLLKNPRNHINISKKYI